MKDTIIGSCIDNFFTVDTWPTTRCSIFEIIIITAVTYVAKSGSDSLKNIITWSSKFDEDNFKTEGQNLFSGTLKDISGEGHTFYKMDAIPQIPKYLTWHENFPNFYYKYFRTNEAGPEKTALIHTLEEHQNTIYLPFSL